jgi:predicted RecB family nuclease
MSSAQLKSAAERNAFIRFSQLLGEEEAWLSVESREPPEPDLLCNHASLGAVAFELVAITDPLIAQVNAGFGTSPYGMYSTSDPTERIIRKKLGKSYVTPHKIELLVYNDLLVITPDEMIAELVTRWLNAQKHPFRRAWFMGEHSASCIWIAPA